MIPGSHELGPWLLEQLLEGLELSARISLLLGILMVLHAVSARWGAPLNLRIALLTQRIEAWMRRNWYNVAFAGIVLSLFSSILLWLLSFGGQ